jgi:DNA-binding NtrC family response regulator
VPSGPRILVLEDEQLLRWALAERLRKSDFEVIEAADVAAARKHLQTVEPDLLLLDYRLPDGDGIAFLRSLPRPAPPAIVMTAHGSVEAATAAMRAGALDFVSKPFDVEEMALKVEQSLETARLRDEVTRRRREDREAYGLLALLGESAPMRRLRDLVRRVAESPAPTILVLGETGSGKGLVARVIHALSARHENPFVTITCTALPETLLESELFGYEKGAFTDAKQRKRGLFEAAMDGTVFLDEIGDLPATIQAKLLHVLEDQSFRPLGSTREVRVEVRVIAATHRDLQALVREGRFREDLYYRLSAIPIRIPSLRERGPEDVRALLDHFLERFAIDFKKEIRGMRDDARARLLAHGWPGNVRELRNVVERAVLLSRESWIGIDDLGLDPSRPSEGDGHASAARPLPPDEGHGAAPDVADGRSLSEGIAPRPTSPATEPTNDSFALPPGGVVLEDVERHLVRQALDRARGNQTQAARLLGITRDQLRYRVEKFALEPGAAPARDAGPSKREGP